MRHSPHRDRGDAEGALASIECPFRLECVLAQPSSEASRVVTLLEREIGGWNVLESCVGALAAPIPLRAVGKQPFDFAFYRDFHSVSLFVPRKAAPPRRGGRVAFDIPHARGSEHALNTTIGTESEVE